MKFIIFEGKRPLVSRNSSFFEGKSPWFHEIHHFLKVKDPWLRLINYQTYDISVFFIKWTQFLKIY